MKVYDKIYLERILCTNEVDDTWRPDKIFKDDIEYIRTDAFIEKAKKWFEKQNEWYDIGGIKHCDMESFEDFEKYMRGE